MYPPLKAMGSVEPEEFLPHATDRCSVYPRTSFCEQRRTFCHFAKEIPPRGQRVERYLHALHRELRGTGELTGHPLAQTVYFGGGTPS
ncbi:hypothetical protein [Streptomyces cinereospinus]|uniref:Uncharacterized protein n=1 Tax=Streptomyces cinereospinus TaxID=285561 RepID=A0ABV5N723_9ACTN